MGGQGWCLLAPRSGPEANGILMVVPKELVLLFYSSSSPKGHPMPLRKHPSLHPASTLVSAPLSPTVAALMLPTRSIRSPSARASAGSQPRFTHTHARTHTRTSQPPSSTHVPGDLVHRVHTHMSSFRHKHPPTTPLAHADDPYPQIPMCLGRIPRSQAHLWAPSQARALCCARVSSPSYS